MESVLQSPATVGLIIINLIISFRGFGDEEFFETHLFWMGRIRGRGEWNRFFMSAFLHGSPAHLIINMYVLLVFGQVLEQTLGTPEFLLIYLVSLIGGNGWEYFAKAHNPNYRAVGASGATSGIILSYCLFYPFSTLLLFFVVPMWAITLGVGFIIGSYILSQNENSLIGHGAHLGGALAGVAITLILRPNAWGELMQKIANQIG